jgi:hypothetical protein
MYDLYTGSQKNGKATVLNTMDKFVFRDMPLMA